MKNKFFDNKPATKLEEKVPQEIDLEMDCEEEKETVDFEMRFEEECPTVHEMEIDEMPCEETSDMKVEAGDLLEDAKNKWADRWKTILKELEVCDLLDLRNPQCVAEYATNIYD